MTPLVPALAFTTCAAFALGWLKGGHTERFAVLVLLSDQAVSRAIVGVTGAHEAAAVPECVAAAIFVWLALRSDRWWTLAAAAALVLCSMVFALEWSHPVGARNTAISASIGLWWVAMLSLLAGVGERWLAGEVAVSRRRIWRPRPGRGPTAPPLAGKEGSGA